MNFEEGKVDTEELIKQYKEDCINKGCVIEIYQPYIELHPGMAADIMPYCYYKATNTNPFTVAAAIMAMDELKENLLKKYGVDVAAALEIIKMGIKENKTITIKEEGVIEDEHDNN